MLAKIFSAAPIGVTGHLIEIEASLESALPQIHITGLPGTVVRESRDRIRACLNSLGFSLPSGRITLHLSPAELPKSGSHYDLAMALCLLGAEKRLNPARLKQFAALGELALDGRIRKVTGAVSLLERLDRDPQIKSIFISKENLFEARMIQSKKICVVGHLTECVEILCSDSVVEHSSLQKLEQRHYEKTEGLLDEVIGQNTAKRALEICLAGDHHFLMVGSPGVGKSLLASCVESLMAPLCDQERVDLHKIYGVPGVTDPVPHHRPFRSPHHSISQAGLLGGGSGSLMPGEVSLAHHGVLFLDEIPEFRRDSLEGLREPLQNAMIHHHRAMVAVTYPAHFTLIAAMNPCPCGLSMNRERACRCSLDQAAKYRKRLSGPFLDRIHVAAVMQESNSPPVPFRSHAEVRGTIQKARERRKNRGKPFSIEVEEFQWLEDACKREGISFRGRSNIISVASTITDLAGGSKIHIDHVKEAWGFRCSNLFQRFQNSY